MLDVLKAPFPAGEPAIAYSYWAYCYARDVLKSPFELGEPAIFTDPYYAGLYRNFVDHVAQR